MCSNNTNPYIHKTSQAPFDFKSITNQSFHSKTVIFDNSITFQNKVLVSNTSDKVSFNDKTLFNNDIHVNSMKLGDVTLTESSLDRDSKTSMMYNANQIEEVFTNNYVGGWTNDDQNEYVIQRLKISDTEADDATCVGSNPISNKKACVSKMWTTVRDAKPLNSSVCDCCCPTIHTYTPYCMLKLINLNGDDVVLKTNDIHKPVIYNIKNTDIIHALHLSKTDGVKCVVKFFGNEKRFGDDDLDELEHATIRENEFTNKLTRFIHFNEYLLPENGALLFDNKGTKGSISMNRFDDNAYVTSEWGKSVYKFIPVSNEIDTYYLLHKESDTKLSMHHILNNGNRHQTSWKIHAQTKQSVNSRTRYNTGYFWIVNTHTNDMIWLEANNTINVYPYYGDVNCVWSYFDDKFSYHKSYIGVKLQLI